MFVKRQNAADPKILIEISGKWTTMNNFHYVFSQVRKFQIILAIQ